MNTLLLCASALFAASNTHETKVAGSLPHMADVKTPALNMAKLADAGGSMQRVEASQAQRLPGERALPSSASARLDFSQPLYDTDEHGDLWVRGETYKARFGDGSATFIPFLGSRAPRNFPVDYRLSAVTSGGQPVAFDAQADALRDGERVVIDRGAFVEDYVIARDSIEQRFTFESLPSAGELIVALDVSTELSPRAEAAGLRFENEFGAATYSNAFVFDAAGRKEAIETRFEAGRIALAVPATFLAEAAFPITIDPISGSAALDTNPADSIQADVAYDGTLNREMVAYENVFSATDHDIYVFLLTDGALLGFVTLQLGGEDWRNPAIANLDLADQFLVVAEVGVAPNRSVRGRSCSGVNMAGGPFITISEAAFGGDMHNPDVGGDPSPFAPTYYCVVWQRDAIAIDTDIHGRLVKNDGTLLGTSTLLIDASPATIDTFPSISKTNGLPPATSQNWNVVWQRQYSATDEDVYAARVHWDGALTSPTFGIATTVEDEQRPAASASLDPSSTGRPWMVAYRYAGPSSESDLRCRTVVGTTGEATLDLVSGVLASYGDPTLAITGNQFVVAATLTSGVFPNLDSDIYVSSLYRLNGALFTHEASVVAAGTAQDERRADIASTHGSTQTGPWRSFIAYDREVTTTNHDIYLVAYDTPANPNTARYCSGDGSGTACPCGNNGLPGRGCASSVNANGAQLSAAGIAYVTSDSFNLIADGMPATATCLYFQGTSAQSGGAGAAFGDGLRCAAGSTIRLGSETNVGGTSSYGYPNDVAIHIRGAIPAGGATRYYQAWYRNSAAFCTSSTFNLTNGVSTTWLP